VARVAALDVWLYGTRAATLSERRTGTVVLAYSDEARDRWGIDAPVLSLSLPLPPDGQLPPARARTWLEGLVPEGEARTAIEDALGVRRGDLFGLLRESGRDCAGAVVLQPAGSAAPPEPGPPAAEALTDAELGEALDQLPDRPMGIGAEIRVSLAGQQPKLVLARTADGAWGRPVGGAPSTHILKPQDERLPGSAVVEAACVNAAASLGLGGGAATVEEIGGREVLVAERYDRSRDPESGAVRRIHQEDLCQALGIDPSRKYWHDSGAARLEVAARALDSAAADGHGQLLRLARATAFHVAIGNADAHAKNHTLLLLADGDVRLAPVYDAMATVLYATRAGRAGEQLVSRRLALPIAEAATVDEVRLADLAEEAATWGLDRASAHAEVVALLEQLPGALRAAAGELRWRDGLGTAERLVSTVTARVEALLAGAPAGEHDPTRGEHRAAAARLTSAATRL
jgi:serine/threonine-protein kinase HipA